ncbi:MAG: methyl-accepting chemotaxis protein [Gemmatimonadaceae bacterium]|nr:methyl-accepting chemotaxis protein [Gemmatimonadaceae bacterium]MDQ3520574.1 methyl-accepting chemotaxis protein [Gemmatimonadota bacterium]
MASIIELLQPAAVTGSDPAHGYTPRAGYTRRRGMRVRTKIIALAVAPLLPVFLFLGWHELPRVFWDVQLGEARESATAISAMVAQRPSAESVGDAFTATRGKLLFLSLVGPDGKTVAMHAEGDSIRVPADIAQLQELRGERRNYRELWVVTPAADGAKVVLGWSLDYASSNWYRTRLIFTGATLAAILAAALAALLLSRPVTRPLEAATHTLGGLTSGNQWDLRTRVNATKNDEIGELGDGINHFIAELAGLVSLARSAAEKVVRRAEDIFASTHSLSASGERLEHVIGRVSSDAAAQSASAVRASAAAASASSAAGEMLASVGAAEARSSETLGAARAGLEGVAKADEAVERIVVAAEATRASFAGLERGLQAIAQAVTKIAAIAKSTNLIALNAAIEAARAGEHGRGFAVVADEVRKLAADSEKLAAEIRNEIKSIQTGVTATSDDLGRANAAVLATRAVIAGTGEAIRIAEQRVDATASILRHVASLAEAQRSESRRIEEQASQVASLSHNHAEAAQEMSRASIEQTAVIEAVTRELKDLQAVAAEMLGTVRRFQV